MTVKSTPRVAGDPAMTIEDEIEAVRLAMNTSDIDLRMKLSRALARLEASRWRPIKTCPEYQDGIKIIVYGGRHIAPEICVADGGWWNSADMVGGKSRPTHWMPLPSPSTTSSEGGEG